MPNITQLHNPVKYCIDCNCELTLNDNWTYAKQRAWLYICNDCEQIRHQVYRKSVNGMSVIRKDYEKNKKYFDNFKKGFVCAICGYDKYMEALEFHHVVPKDKKFHIGAAGMERKDFFDELQKCICLCANCHSHVTKLDRKEI